MNSFDNEKSMNPKYGIRNLGVFTESMLAGFAADSAEPAPSSLNHGLQISYGTLDFAKPGKKGEMHASRNSLENSQAAWYLLCPAYGKHWNP